MFHSAGPSKPDVITTSIRAPDWRFKPRVDVHALFQSGQAARLAARAFAEYLSVGLRTYYKGWAYRPASDHIRIREGWMGGINGVFGEDA